MYDSLAYRIPEQAVVKKTGRFKAYKNADKGFVFSNFKQSKTYTFEPKELPFEQEFKPHFSENEPHCISQQTYLNYGNELIKKLKSDKLNKIVFSRIKKVVFDHGLILDLFDALCTAYPKAFVYLITSSEVGTWIGATPETLIHSKGNRGFSMALAGTREKNTQEPWNTKEYNEQQWVSDYLQETLERGGQKEIEQNGPYEIDAGNLKHLRTDFSFELGSQEPIEIAMRLHPTPAVAGLPKNESLEFISNVEEVNGGYSRDLYAGFLGLIGDNESQLYVNLRCAQFFENAAFLYVGGGYTKNSIAESEWNETEHKSKTLLKIFEML